jgi:hypothetical protein
VCTCVSVCVFVCVCVCARVCACVCAAALVEGATELRVARVEHGARSYSCSEKNGKGRNQD